jgi:predicted Fe-S protein YdhL (DUF1289 family)
MKNWILASIAAAALAFGIVTASAQLQGEGGVATKLTDEQRIAIRGLVKERLAIEFRERLAERLSEAADELSALTPEQRTAIRNAVKTRLASAVGEGLPDQLGTRLADRLGDETLIIGVRLTPAQRAALGRIIEERLSDDMREGIVDRLAEASAAWTNLSAEQRMAVLGAVRARLADEVKGRIGDGLAEEIGQKLSESTIGSGQQ